MGGARTRPSLVHLSRFAVAWHVCVWWGLLLLGWGLWTLVSLPASQWERVGPPLAILFAMVVLGELRPVVASRHHEADGVPLSAAFAFAALILWGLAPAVVLYAVSVTMSELLARKDPWKLFFNIGQYVLSLAAAWTVLVLGGVQTSLATPLHSVVPGDLGWIVLSGVVFHLVNLALVAGVSQADGVGYWDSFTDNFWYYTFTMLAVLAMSPFIAVMAALSWQFVPLLLLPLFGIYTTAAVARAQERQATHDALTDLPNRTLFGAQLTATLEERARIGGGVAVFLLDLDRFKEVNDTLGHSAGDQLLEVVARRLLSAVRPDDTVARLGGDEFAVLLPGIERPQDAIEVAGRIRAALAEPFRLEGVLMDVDVSIGIAFAPIHGEEVEPLMRRADVAMYVAKGEQTGIEVYDGARDPNSTQRLGTVTALREALDNGDLELHYQPKVSLIDGTVTGAEALVRWRHHERGLIPPEEFVPLAERTGLVHRITHYVLGAALAQVADWWARGIHVPIAVNVSMRDLQDPEFAELVARELDRRGLPARAMMLEVTESVLVQDPGQAVATLRELRDLGVHSSLDDFGTGYSSLLLLEQLPVRELKIDRSFVLCLDNNGDDSMVRSIVGFAHGLGLTVVAEGVESTQTWRLLREIGCDAAQGYRVSLPMPAAEATRWLLDRIEIAAPPASQSVG